MQTVRLKNRDCSKAFLKAPLAIYFILFSVREIKLLLFFHRYLSVLFHFCKKMAFLGSLTQQTSAINDTPLNDTPSLDTPEKQGLFSSVTSNPLFSAGFGLIAVGTALSLFKKGTTIGASALRRKMLVTLEIPSKDKSYLWFLQWMSHNAPKRQVNHLAVETSFKQHDNGSVSTKFGLVPGPGTHYFKYRNIWMQVQRQRDGKMMDLTTGSPWETITITTLSRDREVFKQLLHEAQEMALKKQEGKTVLYTSYGPEWRPFGMPRKRRLLDSVILDKGITDRIVNDVKAFIGNGKWYNERGIPYRRGYLLYGPPGSGKSSFIQALAVSFVNYYYIYERT